MSQNQEIIESKLCAYIDDELDPEGRAEIEKHLEANPQHRRLLESLRATRDLIRWLPREQAPPELSETLNGQLERSVLLEYGGDSLRIRRAPRVFAAAAIIALTAGLGAAVYFALPRSQKSAVAFHGGTESGKSAGSDVVPSPMTPEAPVRAETDHTAEIASKMKMADEKSDKAPAPTIVEATKGSIEREVATKSGAADEALKKGAELDQLALEVSQNPDAFTAAVGGRSRKLEPTQVAGNRAVVMLVRADAPERAQKQLTTFLDSQQIQWRQAPMSQQSQAAVENSLADNGANNSIASSGVAPGVRQDAAMNESQLLRSGSQQSQRYAGKEAYQGKDLDNGKNYDSSQALPALPPGAANRVDTQPSAPQPLAIERSAAPTTRPSEGASNPFYAQGKPLSETLTNSYRAGGIYVCQMSRRQAAQLSDTISHDPTEAAEVRDLAGVAYATVEDREKLGKAMAAETQPVIARGVVLEPTAEPTTRPSDADRVMAKSAAVAGGSLDTLNRKQPQVANADLDHLKAEADKAAATQPILRDTLAMKLKTEQTPAPPAGAVEVANAPAPAPAGTPVPATAPTTEPVGSAALADAPAATTADEPVNVVILVQQNEPAPTQAAAPAGPTTQAAIPPATQPASASPAQTQPAR